MKPDWKDAPEWAQYVAMDSDGYWCWYELKPFLSAFGWCRQDDSKIKFFEQLVDWQDTLQERPKVKPDLPQEDLAEQREAPNDRQNGGKCASLA